MRGDRYITRRVVNDFYLERLQMFVFFDPEHIGRMELNEYCRQNGVRVIGFYTHAGSNFGVFETERLSGTEEL